MSKFKKSEAASAEGPSYNSSPQTTQSNSDFLVPALMGKILPRQVILSRLFGRHKKKRKEGKDE